MTDDTLVIERPVEVLVEQRPEMLVVQNDLPSVVVVDGQALPEVLIDEQPELLVLDTERPVVLLDAGEQGPPGPAGRDGSAVSVLIAGADLGGHRVVRSSAGRVVYADCTEPASANIVLGITTGAAADGALVPVQTAGLMTEPSWAWTPDLPVFAGVNGLLTQEAPPLGFRLIVGIATGSHQIHIGLKSPIVLE